MKTSNATEHQDCEENEFSPGDRSFHGVCSDMEEFSKLLARVSTKVLWNQLMTQPQRTQAQQRWQQNGGSSLDSNTELRHYMEQVLMEDHVKQWEEAEKQGKLSHIQ